ncbi:hypothetical protein HK099_000732 [Clydaea vesicula]|uniref:Uncharacterized protein n=1 Tax=Clydaea vesicula TaxID=447962 RepID=A0AAD5TWZ6_9FUNG|nr:hypothetical protein HK099_000732 [Clydaea vesicula]
MAVYSQLRKLAGRLFEPVLLSTVSLIFSTIQAIPASASACKNCPTTPVKCTKNDKCSDGKKCFVIPQTCEKCSYKVCSYELISRAGGVCNVPGSPNIICGKNLYCKQESLSASGKCHVFPSKEGGPCDEYTMPAEASHDCEKGLTCQNKDENLPDSGGICLPARIISPVGGICNGSSYECDKGLYCKNQKCAVLPSKEGGPCNEFTMPIEASHDCEKGLICQTINENLPDLGGICVAPKPAGPFSSTVTLEQVTYQGFGTYTALEANECTKLPLTVDQTRDYGVELRSYTNAYLSIFDNEDCSGSPKVETKFLNSHSKENQQFSDDGAFKKANGKSVRVLIAQA